MPEKIAYLDANGVPLVQRGEYTGGRYAYMDSNAQLGTILELWRTTSRAISIGRIRSVLCHSWQALLDQQAVLAKNPARPSIR